MITLKDLMLQKQAEEAQDMYNKRVCLGVEKLDDRSLKKHLSKASEARMKNTTVSNSNVPESTNSIQKRRLPNTPDYEESFKLDDVDILYTRSKEGQKLRDFGYELISGDDTFNLRNSTSSSGITSTSGSIHSYDVKRQEGGGSIKKKSRNWISSDKRNEESSSSDRSLRDSFKKSKNKAVIAKLDNIKASSEKLFQFKHSSNNEKESLKTKQLEKSTPILGVSLKQPAFVNLGKSNPGTPLLDQATIFTTTTAVTTSNFAIAAGQTYAPGSGGGSNPAGGFLQGGVKKSNTCNNSSDFKENASKVQTVRKNSAPERSASYFTKLSFSGSAGKTAKEKKLLGSPGLHRAIFGKNQQQQEFQPTAIDHEVFSPISFTKNAFPSDASLQSNSTLTSTITIGNLQTTTTTTSVLTSNLSNRNSPDYPNMEYPPVFEAETYSLSDPSMTLLKRRQNHHQK